jgi:hypothetical protein
MEEETATAKKMERVEKAKWKAQRKKERLPLLLWMHNQARQLGVHPIYPDYNDNLVEQDPTPESDRGSPRFLSREVPGSRFTDIYI